MSKTLDQLTKTQQGDIETMIGSFLTATIGYYDLEMTSLELAEYIADVERGK